MVYSVFITSILPSFRHNIFLFLFLSYTVNLIPLLSYINCTVISLSCELTAYLTTSSDIQWIRDNTIITNGTKYSITKILGSSKAINSSGMMT